MINPTRSILNVCVPGEDRLDVSGDTFIVSSAIKAVFSVCFHFLKEEEIRHGPSEKESGKDSSLRSEC